MRKQSVIVYALVASAAVFVGCGSGGGRATLPAAAGGGATATGPNQPATQGVSKATFTLTIPSGSSASAVQRSPKFISPNTESVAVSVQVGTGAPSAPTVANLTPTSPNCTTTASGTSCAVTVVAPIGTDTFIVSLYSGINAGGSILSTATISQNVVVAATANSFPLTLNGTVANVAISVTNGNNLIPGGSATTLPVVVTAYDASGAAIVGPGNYSNPITLTNADLSGSTVLSPTTLTAPGTAVTLSYCPAAAQAAVGGCLIQVQGLPFGATTIGANASPAPTVSPGTFQYIADRFSGYNLPLLQTGTETIVTTTYPNPPSTAAPVTSTVNYLYTSSSVAIPNASFAGNTYTDIPLTETFTQVSPATTASPQTQVVDRYRHTVLTATGGISYEYGQNIVNNLAGGVITNTTVNNYVSTPLQLDILPHVQGASWNDPIAFTQVNTSSSPGGTNSTLTFNLDGSQTFSRTTPTVGAYTVAANQTGTNTASNGTVTTIGLPIPAPSGTGFVIPVVNSSPSPNPTFNAVDWYPGNALPVSPPRTESWVDNGNVPIPAACNIPGSVTAVTGTTAFDLQETVTQVGIANPFTTNMVQHVYYVSGFGTVCVTVTGTTNNYRLTNGSISQSTVTTEALSTQNTSQLASFRRRQ